MFKKKTNEKEFLTENVYGCIQVKKCSNDLCCETCASYKEKGCYYCPINEAIEKLHNYEKLEQQGRLKIKRKGKKRRLCELNAMV